MPQELQKIRDRARDIAKHTQNPMWIRAWERLEDATDQLDALIARNTIFEDGQKK
jgi:hypothetical protein